jgi:hypothetical protein
MIEELDKWEQLVKDYPNLYATGMYFEVPDRWYPIIEEMSRSLESKIERYMEENPEATHDNFNDGIPCAVQVKEKWGGLRFYMNFTPDDSYEEIIELAEQRVWKMEKK